MHRRFAHCSTLPQIRLAALSTDVHKCGTEPRRLANTTLGVGIGIGVAIAIRDRFAGLHSKSDCDTDIETDADSDRTLRAGLRARIRHCIYEIVY